MRYVAEVAYVYAYEMNRKWYKHQFSWGMLQRRHEKLRSAMEGHIVEDAYSRDLEAELHVLQEENARLQHALMWVDDGYLDMYDSVYPSPNIIEQLHLLDLIPRPYNASEEESLFVFPSEVRIEGLETLDYLDNLSDRKCFTEQGDAITFESEVDRAYLSTEDCIAVLDHGKKFEIKKGGLSFYRRFYCSPRSWKEV
ncbi:hypothetical protein AgCh_007078 [Apium graveolens]